MRIANTPRDIKSRRGAPWMIAVGTVCTFALLAPAGPAASLERRSQDLTGATIACGEDVLTFTAGVQVGALHRVLLGNGKEVVIVKIVLHEATLSDAAGSLYRAVGGASSTARVTAEGDADSLAGHFNVNINVLGDNGRVGKVMLRERTSRDGTVVLVTGGGCAL